MNEKVVVIEVLGGLEQLKLVDVEVGVFGLGEICICYEVCGLNYIDVYYCNGIYLLFLLVCLGMEGVGVVEVVGEGVMYFKLGDCVVYVSQLLGVYVMVWVMLVKCVLKLFDVIFFEIGVVMMFKGLMVQYLLCKMLLQGGLQVGDFLFFYVVVGGVGLIVC